MAKYGKRTTEAKKAFAGKFNVTVEDAVALIKANSKAKFDETVEIAMNLGVDPRLLIKWSEEWLTFQMVLGNLYEWLFLLVDQRLRKLKKLALI